MSGSVTTTVNYADPAAPRPYVNNSDYDDNRVSLLATETTMTDVAVVGAAPQLDVEGFACFEHVADLDGLHDSTEEATARYRAALAHFMIDLTGADEVILSPNLLFRYQSPPPAGDFRRAATADFVHSDYSPMGAVQAIPHLYPTVNRPGIGRSAMYNLWRLLSPAPTSRPLALCDARSVLPGDLVAGDSVFPTRGFQFETAFFRYNPDHRWIYFPRLTRDELLVFKQSDTDTIHPQVVPHTAFDDPSCSDRAAPRVSVEARCIALWNG